jgi:flavin reductase
VAFDIDPRWLGDTAWPAGPEVVDASSGAEPPYDLHAQPVDPPMPPGAFKEALAQLASGLAIISCWDGSTPRGLLVSSITGLSVDPPRFLFCVRKEASSHEVLVRSERCGVAILAEHDEAEALRFSTSSLSHQRFAPETWNLTDGPSPTYRGGLSTTACMIDQRIDTGTHTVFIVTAASVTLALGRPLVAHARSFQRLAI